MTLVATESPDLDSVVNLATKKRAAHGYEYVHVYVYGEERELRT
jgi:hypothetical protein